MSPAHDPQPLEIVVPPALAGRRVDQALVELLDGVSRSRVQELVADGGVWIDGQRVGRASRILARGERLEVRRVPRSRERPGGPARAELVVVWEDEHLAVIDKPAGQLVHPSGVVRGQTVSDLALLRWGALPAPQGADRPGIVHRLDAETSGLLVIAKTDAAARGLVEAFRARAVEKTYLALVYGEPRFDSEWIDAPLVRQRGRIAVAPEEEDGDALDAGREALTFYEVCERFGCAARLDVLPKTGRTHQIRVHLASIGHPILGDGLYRGKRGSLPVLPASAPRLERHALHARALRFAHPVTGADVACSAGNPADLERLLEWLRTPRAGG
jgi:23S rRNA pseudouridine1911/1915/1917 synthase